jgi:hypothetical protein
LRSLWQIFQLIDLGVMGNNMKLRSVRFMIVRKKSASIALGENGVTGHPTNVRAMGFKNGTEL